MAIPKICSTPLLVLLFAFVFGGAIPLPGKGSYREFLMPGIFAQTVCFAAAITAVGMTECIVEPHLAKVGMVEPTLKSVAGLMVGEAPTMSHHVKSPCTMH